MLKIIIVFGILAIVVLGVGAYMFRHELETLAHTYGLRDDRKKLKHELKRKQKEYLFLSESLGDTMETRQVYDEITELKKLIREMGTK